jgi:hypothetical protein
MRPISAAIHILTLGSSRMTYAQIFRYYSYINVVLDAFFSQLGRYIACYFLLFLKDFIDCHLLYR